MEKYPKMLYVVKQDVYMFYGVRGHTQLIGKKDLADAVPDNDGETVVATYQLVGVSSYKKIVTKTSIVEEVK